MGGSDVDGGAVKRCRRLLTAEERRRQPAKIARKRPTRKGGDKIVERGLARGCGGPRPDLHTKWGGFCFLASSNRHSGGNPIQVGAF